MLRDRMRPMPNRGSVTLWIAATRTVLNFATPAPSHAGGFDVMPKTTRLMDLTMRSGRSGAFGQRRIVQAYTKAAWSRERMRRKGGPPHDRLRHCRLLVDRRRHARFDKAHVPSIGVAPINHDDAAVLFAKMAIRSRHSDGELG